MAVYGDMGDEAAQQFLPLAGTKFGPHRFEGS
jgi:hypothetical protein